MAKKVSGRPSGRKAGGRKSSASRATGKSSKRSPARKSPPQKTASRSAESVASGKPGANSALGHAGSLAARPSSARRKGGAGISAAVSRASAVTKATGEERSAANRSAAAALLVDTSDVTPPDLSALKTGKLYYRIGEVSQITGVKPYVLRYWESEFRLMAPQKSRSKQRLYRRKDIEMILLIRTLLYEERYTIAGARQRLRELGAGRASSARAKDAAEASPAADSEVHSAEQTDRAAWADAEADHRRRFQEIREELVSIRASL